jgi:hypothetical protein
MSKRSKKQIPKGVAQSPSGHSNVFLKNVEKEILALPEEDESSDNESPYVALKYFDSSFECFSDWHPDELKAFSNFIDKLNKVSWLKVLQNARKKQKSGLGCTKHPDHSQIRSCTQKIDNISEDINVIEMRVTEAARVHGFRIKSAFFIILLDRKHRVLPSK